MKKLLLTAALFLLVLGFTQPSRIFAQEGDCESLGGRCLYRLTQCSQTELGGLGELGCDNSSRCCGFQPVSGTDLFCGSGGINTAIGCIPVGDTNEFVGFFLRWAMGVGGGIAFLLIVYSGIMISTSSGNPERLQAGRELLTSAVAGLIMLIFSVFILRIIGVDILGIPGLN